ncbi:MAG: hypothetical protein RL648_1365 [Verrucomicrobiota bacterium]|jgi:hypothetical protein
MSKHLKGGLSMDHEGGSFLTVSGSPALAELRTCGASAQKEAQCAGSGEDWLR